MARPSGAREPSPSLDDALAAYSIDSHAGMKAYLDRAAETQVPAGECPRVLMALARVARLTEAGCTWMTGSLWVEISPLAGRSIIDVYVDQEGSQRERMMPGVLVELSLAVIEHAVGAHSVEILPLRRSRKESALVLIPRDDSDIHQRTTRPIPAVGPYEPPTKSGKHKKQT